jgi:uncharacterized protein YyaL (SSP411 family)
MTASPLSSRKKSNRLIIEKSPYLLQHAYNPVDWYAWGEEAFAKSHTEQRPIFLSIGYSTCHWCHVMERESFENETIAEMLNHHFVSIKVDREERPDVDRVYMTALQGMGQNGGWPLSMFLTPDLKPFYGGTYFPPETRYGRIGFPDILRRIQEIWENEREKVSESADGIATFLQQVSLATKPAAVGEAVFDTCFQQISKSFDSRHGGFGGAPKFPRPVLFNFLFRYFRRTGNTDALQMSAFTLSRMSQGGVYDQIGGGFHRYSTDAEWRVPHFEKMLYDQAQLIVALIDAYLLTKDEFFATVVHQTAEYVLRDLTGPEGSFYSAEDADSIRAENPGEAGEGAFYVWTRGEILNLIGEELGQLVCYHFGVEDGGNALFDPQHEFTGRNILYVAHGLKETAEKFNKPEAEVGSLLQGARDRLFDARLKRPRPHRDDKVLTSWNGLMISALARAYQALDVTEYLTSASKAAFFLIEHLLDSGKKVLMRRYRDGEAKHEGHLDDYAFFVQGLLDLYEASLDTAWLEHAIRLTEMQLDLFWDGERGGFFDGSGKDLSILVRMKEQYDGAEPAGNSIAALNLLRLAEMTDKDEWRRKAEECISLFGETLRRQPNVMPQMVSALDFHLGKKKQIVIAGLRDRPDTKAMVRVINARYQPNRIVVLADGGDQQELLARHLPFVRGVSMVRGKATAYICEGYVCKLPTSDLEELERLLGE